ncbi:MAG: Flp pilus assembly complex ATPase component TadA, partial [Lentisphaerae bacterium]|nr:Flp pilus assembly complex ATPase component TadA [Lentisphaerota bacterium]
QLIDMREAIALLKTTRPTFYRWLRAGKIKGMKLGRQWRFYREDVERFLKGKAPRVDLPADLSPLIETLRNRLEQAGEKPPDMEGRNPVQQAVRLMILAGLAGRASDIHISPQIKEDGAGSVSVLRYRIDGVLHPAAEIDIRLLPAIAQEWKRLAACDPEEKEKPQDGRILIHLTDFGPERSLDMRVCFLPAALGPSITGRLLETVAQLELGRMGYAPPDSERIHSALALTRGMIVATGPTGSGKTTTLYACVSELAVPERKVMSIENPVEYLLPWVTQVEVDPAKGRTFPGVLRSVLRSDPDVILFGEIRSLESLEVCQQAALTGHLVLTTLHTEEAAGALTRMVDMGSDPFLVADCTQLVIAQRLIRRLCAECSVADAPPDDQVENALAAAARGGLAADTLPREFRKPVGCDRCSGTGYRGRFVIAETLEFSPEMGSALRGGAPLEELRRIAVEQGMTTMAADGVRRATQGETTLDEIRRVTR